MIGRRRPRDWSVLAADPNTPLMVGRLLGANELAVALLSQPDETPNANHIAEVLSRQSAFFFDQDPAAAAPSSAVTAQLRPGQ